MKKSNRKGPTVGVRFTVEDEKLATALQKKLGLNAFAEVVRLALRKLAATEGITT